MAESDFIGSIVIGSTKDFDHSCTPCGTAGQSKEAHGYCVDCQEYLCQSCFTAHQRTRASSKHFLIDDEHIRERGIPKLEKCSIHQDKEIMYFCLVHKQLACQVCQVLQHKECKLDYIPDKSKGIGDSVEYKTTITKLEEEKNKIDTVTKKASEREKDVDKCHSNLTETIDKFEKDMINRIRQLRDQIQTEVDSKRSENQQKVDSVLQTCSKDSSEISEQLSNLKDSKTSNQNCQLYIAMKKAQAKLECEEISKAEDELDSINTQYRFDPNNKLMEMKSEDAVLGTLSTSTQDLETVIHREDIIVKTPSDQRDCGITGCVAMSSDRLVLADYHNQTLKVVKTNSLSVIEVKQLESGPYEITALSNDEIAVTLPEKSIILIAKLGSGPLTIVKTIPVKGCCMGITSNQNHLYVVCKKPNEVLKIDKTGKVCSSISLSRRYFKDPRHIAIGKEAGLIYISDYDRNSIVSLTYEGEVTAVKKNLPGPYGMCVLSGGSLLVCCYNGTLYHVTGELKTGMPILEGLPHPRSICYNRQEEKVYIGTLWCNLLKVFRLKYRYVYQICSVGKI